MMLRVPTIMMPRSGLGYLGADCTDEFGNTYTCPDTTTPPIDTTPPVTTPIDTTTVTQADCAGLVGMQWSGGQCVPVSTNSNSTTGSGPGGAFVPGDPGYAAALAQQCSATGGSVSPGGAGCSYPTSVTCNAAGGTWNGSSCSTPNVSVAPAATGAAGFLNALAVNTPLIVRAITGQTVTQAQCKQVGGTFNAAMGSCSPSVSSYMPLLLVAGAGIALLVILGNRGHR